MPRIPDDQVEAHKAATHRRILDAAQELFSSLGYRATSLADVAGRAGIGRTTIYEYFSHKEDVLVTLVEETLPQAIAEMVAEVPGDLDPPTRLAELAVRMMEFVATDHHVGPLLMREVPVLSVGAQQRIMASHARLVREFLMIYEEGVEAGDFRDTPLDLAAWYIQDLIMSSARALIASDDPFKHLHEVSAALAGFLRRGLAAD